MEGELIRHFKRIAIALVVICMTQFMTPVEHIISIEDASSISFRASEPDSDGMFSVTMSIANAYFNAFQVVLRYDKETVIPVDDKGTTTNRFSMFAHKINEPEWLSTVGTNIDLQKGLIQFTGFVTPGDYISTDGLAIYPGCANIGHSGLEVYNFHFQKTSTSGVVIEIATQSIGAEYSEFLPEGVTLLRAGEKLPVSVYFELPEALDGDATGGFKPIYPSQDEVSITLEQRLQSTLILQTENNRAILSGKQISIDFDNRDVKPYIDENNRTMVPVRFIAEQLGAVVGWDNRTKQVTITSPSHAVALMVGSKEYVIDGSAYVMDTEPVIVKGWNRTFVPVRFVIEAMDYAVEWDSLYRLVLITEKGMPWQLGRDIENRATQHILSLMRDATW